MRYPQTRRPHASDAGRARRGHYTTDAGRRRHAHRTARQLRRDRLADRLPHADDTRPRRPTAPGSTTARRSVAACRRHERRGRRSSRPRADFDPTDANIAAIYRWIDNTETAGDRRAPITDPELARRNGYTPLGRSLFYARMYYDNFVKAKDAADSRPQGGAAARTSSSSSPTATRPATTTAPDSSTLQPATTCAARRATRPFHPEVQACQLLPSRASRPTSSPTPTSPGDRQRHASRPRAAPAPPSASR